MKSLALLLIALVVAWPGTVQAVGGPLGADDARLLLNRTSFGAAPKDVAEFARLTREQAIDRLLSTHRATPQTPPPPWAEDWVPLSRLRAMPEAERRAVQRQGVERGQDLKVWWLAEMLGTPSPFSERMTLFWHNHFVSSLRKVRAPQLMYQQNLLLRRHALGNFGDMLHAVIRDPAMIVYLDNASNRKGAPNENLARELMELFTLGEGNYTERDVKEAARALTGLSIDGESGQFVFRRAAHDDGTKTVLGRTGEHDGEDLIDILLAHPRTAEHIVAKLWREFVSPDPDPAEVRRIAQRFRESRYDIRTAMRMLLGSEAFYAPANRATLVKSPVELIIGTLRQFSFDVADPFPFVIFARQLGQDLLAPPNVKGWPGGEAWINSTTLLARKQLLERLFRVAEIRPTMAAMIPVSQEMAQGLPGPAGARERMARAMMDIRIDADRWMLQFERRDEQSVARFLLPTQGVLPLASHPTALDTLRAITQDPTYQLK
jgi:uncharacterized protein (DUF1800 family)